MAKKKCKDLIKYIKKHKPKKFRPSIIVNTEHNTIDILLKDRPCYHDWITHEGADICLLRAFETDEVIGAILPFYADPKKIKLIIH